MPAVVLVLIIVVIVVVLLRVREARTGAPARPSRARPRPRGQAVQATPAHEIDEAALAAHVTKLREAVDGGLISVDEGAASIVRHTRGALSDEAARQLLRR